MKKRHIIITIFLVSALMFVLGCGKLGEKEAEGIVKKACRIPDSFVKVDYQVNEKTGLAFMDFKAKNALGVEIPGRAYFKVTKDKIEAVDTEGVPANVIEEFVKDHPNEFSECIASYKKLKSIVLEQKFSNMFVVLKDTDCFCPLFSIVLADLIHVVRPEIPVLVCDNYIPFLLQVRNYLSDKPCVRSPSSCQYIHMHGILFPFRDGVEIIIK